MTQEKKEIETNLQEATISKQSKKASGNTMLVGVISLGCDKNRVDSEIMLTYLANAGYKFTSDASNADILIVNTCGFIESARDESMDAINEMSEYRKDPNARCKRLIVTGCMPQKWSNIMREEFPEVDIFLGIDQYPDIVKIIETSLDSNKKIVKVGGTKTLPYIKNRMVTTPMHYAYLKVSDGCDNYCTFCTIPYIRGRYRSRSMEDIYDEAVDLVDAGAREIILVAQDTSRYGIDKTGKPELVKLIKKLSTIEDLRWIRILYCYPEMLTDDLLNEIVNNPKVCKYIDIPLQHISDNILKKMNRRTSKQDIIRIVENLQKQPTFVAVRTTFMVGFPGETEENFNELCDFVQKYKLMNVGFFTYSKEEGTAAALLADQIEEDVKKKRVLKLIKIQKKVVAEVNKKFIGKTLDVVYEGIDYSKQLFFGRSMYHTPEADAIVYFKSKVPVDIGKIYKVKITKVKGYDLQGEIEYEN